MLASSLLIRLTSASLLLPEMTEEYKMWWDEEEEMVRQKGFGGKK